MANTAETVARRQRISRGAAELAGMHIVGTNLRKVFRWVNCPTEIHTIIKTNFSRILSEEPLKYNLLPFDKHLQKTAWRHPRQTETYYRRQLFFCRDLHSIPLLAVVIGPGVLRQSFKCFLVFRGYRKPLKALSVGKIVAADSLGYSLHIQDGFICKRI